ncbi:MAG: sigma 54-interacting transcriptional regulator [Chromatiaceae bacterium]
MNAKKQILLVDDDVGLLKLLSMRLRGAGFDVATAKSGEEALGRLLARQPDVVISDLRMDGMDGMALFSSIHDRHPSLPVIILTAHGNIPDAVDATRKGVFGYLTKPFDSGALLECVNDALQHSSSTGISGAVDKEDAWRQEIITCSSVMEGLLREAKAIAGSDVSILLQSESGTGKELLAQAIHRASARSQQRFIPVNCAAIPEPLLESELFGHRKGAFTGAMHDHVGLFQTANDGTLFLDEIGDMPMEFQAKLLRVLQEKEIRPVGSSQTVPVDVRIISATHRDLDLAITEGTFREDLYYRLNVVTLEVPPLSERREDIPLLASHFLAAARKRLKKTLTGFSKDAMEMLLTAPWPGNVRQLLNTVEQVAVLTTSPLIPASLVQRALRGKTGEILPFSQAQSQFEKDYLVRIMQVTHGNVAQAARLAKRNRTEFYKLLNRHHLEPALFREDSGK